MGYGEAAHFAHDTSDTHATHPYGNVRNTFEERSEQADSEVAGSEDAGGVGGDQFIETMRNLQEIVGQRPVSGGGASDKRKMSEMTANYTDVSPLLLLQYVLLVFTLGITLLRKC